MTGGSVAAGVSPENRLSLGEGQDCAHASDLTDADHTRSPRDELLLDIVADARQCHWLICQSLCLGPGGVNMALSTGRTLLLQYR